MAGNLIQPRVRVFWGKTNLSSYDGQIKDFPKNTPVVYDIEVHLQAETEGPTAQMKWDPTGPGMKVYESFILNPDLMATQITIEYYIPGGKKITFRFVWTGQSINYGNDMTITVKMQSELAGLINANIRNTAQAYEKGASANSMVERAKKQFGLQSYKSLVRYTNKAKTDLERAKLLTSYGNDWTFGANINNIATQTGNVIFANNIGEANLVFFTPFSWEGDKGEVKNGATDIPFDTNPDPTVRYGYILGPSIINTITRTTEWKPPQQTNDNKPGTQTRARDARGRYTKNNPVPAPQRRLSDPATAAAKTSSPLGTSNGRSTPGIANKDNPDQVPKQNALQDEKVAQLSFQTNLSPILVGIKPHDIVYVPSLKGDFMEDWIVQSVDYDQNDGKFEVNVQASRIYGSAEAMNETAKKKFLDYATAQGLVGPTATLEAWDKYAWSLFSK
jgi:hypothetical protein